MHFSDSKYSHFVSLRERFISEQRQLNLYDYRENKGIECALWPHLYPKHSWCETTLSGNTYTRQTSKVSFMHKLTSEILDYSLEYDLLQFVYDRWLFSTVSAAISSCAVAGKCSATSLDTKWFSIEYWR